MHSSVSDGRLSPAELVRRSSECGMSVIALTDHDSVEGILPALEAATAFPRLRVIPSVEISTDVPQGEVHVLGYFVDYTDAGLLVSLEKMRSSRRKRARGMVDKLRNLGVNIDWERVQQLSVGSSIGRPHIAQAILEKGYIGSFGEAFTKYIGREGPAYVERGKMTPIEAAELILRANGLPVLAHPLASKKNPESLIGELKIAGLVGIEAYYNGYTTDEVEKLVSLADRYDLIATGGSDFHGLGIENETMIGSVDVPMEAAEQLIALAEQQGLKPNNAK